MKSFFQKMKKEEGFTLVELMVVVAIIGLLSAVAVPNFKKYQAKSKMSEAKLQLSALYTAEQAFFSDYNIYATCLDYMGYDPSGEVNARYYAIGFNVAAAIDATAYQTAERSGLQSASCSRTLAAGTTTGTAGRSFFVAGKGVGSQVVTAATELVNTAIGNQTSGTQLSFTAGAAGIISGDFTAANASSALTIDSNKLITTRRNGY